MSVGFPINKSDVDNTLGQISVQLRDSIFRVPGFKARIDAMTDADLLAMNYSADDITLLRASLVDLLNIFQVATGAIAWPEAYDFRTNIAKVTGVA
jgi:tRNA threonylcarbamoyladenosine modification (KEOPS) complex  Pcc1 subunit